MLARAGGDGSFREEDVAGAASCSWRMINGVAPSGGRGYHFPSGTGQDLPALRSRHVTEPRPRQTLHRCAGSPARPGHPRRPLQRHRPLLPRPFSRRLNDVPPSSPPERTAPGRPASACFPSRLEDRHGHTYHPPPPPPPGGPPRGRPPPPPPAG